MALFCSNKHNSNPNARLNELSRLLEENGQFDLAIIMLGTNDLSRFDAGEIAHAIKTHGTI